MKISTKLFLIILLSLLSSSCASLNVAPFDSSSGMRLENDEAGLWERSREEQDKIASDKLIYDDPALTGYLNNILNRIAPADIKNSSLRPAVKIIKDPRLNAFCFPDGVIYVHTGILARMDNEAQAAVLLGHEMAHAVKRHMLKQYRGLKNKSAFASTFYVATAGLGAGIVGTLGELGVMAAFYGYSREHEREADEYGFRLMFNAGYDIKEAPKLFSHLKEDFDKEREGDPFFFSSHPRLEERIRSYNELINAASGVPDPAQSLGGLVNEEKFIGLTRQLMLDDADMDISLGRFETAKAAAEKYIRYFPQDALGYYYLGKIYEQKFIQPENKKLKDFIAKDEFKQKAVEYYERAFSKDAGFALSYKSLGLLYFRQANRGRAKEYLSRYLSLNLKDKDTGYIEKYLKECENE